MSLMTGPLPDQLPFWNSWHQKRGATGDDPVHRELREMFLGKLQGLSRPRVVDLGCGQGHDLVAFDRAGCVVSGLDFSQAAVAQARGALSWWKWWKRRRIRVADLWARLPYDDDTFDGAYSHLALHYFDDATTRAIFEEVRRITKPGGVFVFSVKSIADPYFGEGDKLTRRIFIRNGHLRHFFDRPYLEELLADWKTEDIQDCRGSYASRETSAFLRAVVSKP